MTYQRKEVLADGRATLYLGDCLEVLPTLGPVDAVVTDPPYGLDRDGWDDSYDKSLLHTWIKSWLQVAPWCLFTFSAERLSRLNEEIPDCAKLWRVMVWHKPFTLDGLRANWAWRWEPILYMGRRETKPDWRPFMQSDVFSVVPVATRNHPESVPHNSQKPVELFSQLLKNPVSGLVLDPFMGSGTTGVACMQLGRRFIGVELEPVYFDIACERIDAAARQGDMFVQQAKPEQGALL